MTVEVQDRVWTYNGVEFKVGDMAMIAFPATEDHFVVNGMGPGVDWDNCWVDDMGHAVGGTHEVQSITEQGVEFVDYVDEPTMFPHRGYLYPLSSLVKVER